MPREQKEKLASDLAHMQKIREIYDRLPRGVRASLARDIGERGVKVSSSVFGYAVYDDINLKVEIWINIMGRKPPVPTARENLEALKAKSILKKLLVSNPQSYVLVRDVMGYLLTEYFQIISGIRNQRLYAIIACNYPLEEHTTGEAIIGYELREEGEANG